MISKTEISGLTSPLQCQFTSTSWNIAHGYENWLRTI